VILIKQTIDIILTVDKMSELILYYWPINFRGHLIYCLLDYVNISYTIVSTSDLLTLKNAAPKDCLANFMAPPLLHDTSNNLYLAQTPAIITYLARKYNLYPNPENPMKVALAEKTIHDCSDCLAGLTRNNGAEMWTKEAWDLFSTTRLVRWLQIFENTATEQGLKINEGFFLGTTSITFADLVIVATFHTMEWALGDTIGDILRTNAPKMMALTDRIVTSNEILSTKFQSYKGTVVYCGGFIEQSLRSVLAGGDGATGDVPIPTK
jgi:glutathione S-transferase